MRGQDEDILTNVDYMKKGITLDKLVQNLLVNPELKKSQFYDKILSVDRNAIVLHSRIAAYTWEYPVNVRCPKCDHVGEFEFDLRKQSTDEPLLEEVEYLEDKNLFKLNLSSDIYLLLSPKTVAIDNAISRKLSNKKKKDITNRDLYEDFVVSINDLNHPKLFEQFFNNAPAKFMNLLKRTVQFVNQTTSLDQEYECSECGHIDIMEPPFMIDFLFPKVRKRKK